jgi:DNA-binding HxlR family transcriptional regulator
MVAPVVETDRKSYEQVCPLATALDFIGDRWTILILRELLGGPARFHVLRDGLPGIATNLLTERLRRLEADGLAKRIEAGGSTMYALTDRGAAIRPTLEELGMWGARVGCIGPPSHERSVRAIAMALQSVLVRAGDALPGERLVIELEVDGELAEVVLGQRPTVTARPSLEPDARVRSTTAAIDAVLMGRPFDGPAFTHISGDEAVTKQLVLAVG